MITATHNNIVLFPCTSGKESLVFWSSSSFVVCPLGKRVIPVKKIREKKDQNPRPPHTHREAQWSVQEADTIRMDRRFGANCQRDYCQAHKTVHLRNSSERVKRRWSCLWSSHSEVPSLFFVLTLPVAMATPKPTELHYYYCDHPLQYYALMIRVGWARREGGGGLGGDE